MPHVSGCEECPPDMVSSSGEESEEELLYCSRQVRNAAKARSAACAARAAAARVQKNIRHGFADDSDEDLETRASVSRRESVSKTNGSDDVCTSLKKKRRSAHVLSDAEATESDDEEEPNSLQVSLRTPQKIKNQWR